MLNCINVSKKIHTDVTSPIINKYIWEANVERTLDGPLTSFQVKFIIYARDYKHACSNFDAFGKSISKDEDLTDEKKKKILQLFKGAVNLGVFKVKRTKKTRMPTNPFKLLMDEIKNELMKLQ